ncbi:amino acid adenylation domain-containing protein [Pseudoalteromonas sp. JBTF-M23]|uniref:Amino acid adenylation domain-containing protein n=1 Tax=Pseudoalteromonas caenipelagi TaxID=2726988 RepID=A0A849VKB2_9GAMM|nr:non-ribosomal peptide synthetase [Pseudoalteromonas caenipelagi]NOU52057.1 amino acid adenylation domain-containing protein [Pseudoalteromonas caenipelagi]
MNVWHDFALAANQYRSNTAIEYGSLRYSYDQLSQAVASLQQQVTQRLVSQSLVARQPARIAVYLDKSPLWVASLLMTQKAGHIFIPIDPKWPAKRSQLILRQAQPSIVLCDKHTVSSLSDTVVSDTTNTLLVNDAVFDTQISQELTGESAHQAGYLYFTSGSTGEPKGILGRTDSLAHFIRWQSDFVQVEEQDKASMLTSVGFDPVLRDTLLPLCNGATLVIPTNTDILLDPQATLTFLTQSKVTLVHQVPSIIELWLGQPDHLIAQAFSHIRALMLAGEKLRPELADRVYALAPEKLKLYNLYGPTETTLARFCYPVPRLPLNALKALGATIPVGKPIADSSFLLKQNEHEKENQALRQGEVVIKSQYCSAGYWDAEHLKAVAFADSFEQMEYATGDQGELNCHGDLVILGRLDKQIKINGQRVELAEIELAYERLAEVQKAVVTYHQNAQGAQHIYAHLIAPQALELDQLHSQLAEQLPAYMIPSKVFQHARFELLPNGKSDRMLLLNFSKGDVQLSDVTQLTAIQSDNLAVSWPTEAPAAQTITALWQSVFTDAHFSAATSAFSLGGSSLQLVSLLAQLKMQTGVAIPYFEFAKQPTPLNLLALYHQYEDTPAQLQSSEIADDNALTLAQKGLVFTQQLYPQQPLYNMPYALTFEGQVDVDRLSQALAKLSEHNGLSQAIDLDNFQWCNGLSPALTSLQVAQLVDAKQALEQWAAASFDLEHGPLLKVMVVQSQSHWQLAICAHHLLMDADKFALVFENLLALYHQTALIKAPEQQDNSQLLADYNSAQNYWQQRLDGVNTELDLTGMQYNTAPFSGGLYAFELSEKLTKSLLSVAKQQQVSMNSLLFSAFQVFLFKYSCQSQIITGLPFKITSAQQTRFNINPLPIVTEFDMQQPFSELLARVSQDIQTAIHYGIYPFANMVSDLKLQGTLGVHPVFQSLFAYHENNLPVVYSKAGLDRIDSKIARYSLSADMWLHGSQLKGLFEYGAIAFDEFQAAQIVTHFTQLLEEIVVTPNAPLSHLSLLDEQQHEQLHQLARVSGQMPKIHTIDGMIEAQALATPTLGAVTYQSQTISYEELEARALLWAQQLYHLGVRPNTRVGLSISRSIELVVGFYAILKLGAVYVPLDPDYPAQRREFIIEDTQMRFLLCESQVLEQYQSMDVRCLVFDNKGVIYEHGANSSLSLDKLAELPRYQAEHTGQDVAYIIYTSGSTGKPKGVEVPHIGVCNLAYGEVEFLDMKPGSKVLQFASFSFDTSIWEIVMTLCSGGVLVMADKLAILPGPDLANTLLEQRITHVTLPASSLAALPYQAYPDLSVIITAGEACAIDLLRLWGKGRRFVNSYGPTEASVSASNAELQWDDEQVHIGQPLPNVQTWVLDSAQQLRPQGLPGELYVGGIGVAKGYLNRPELTAEKFVADPFAADKHAKMYRTGDLVRLNQHGQLEFLGRIDEQVKVRGYRIEPSEIETVLRQDAHIIDAKVIVKHLESVPLLVAYVSIGQHTFDEKTLRAYLAEQLPSYMQPDRFVAMQDFPRLPNNKINVKALPEPQMQRTHTYDFDGDDEVAGQVARIWQDFLAVERIAQSDNFFSLGGNSLLAVSMMRVLSKAFAVDLGVSELFRYPTVSELALNITQLLQDKPEQANHSEQQIESQTWYPMTASQQRLYYLQQLDEQATSYNLVFCDFLTGELQPDKLYGALELTLKRHGGLRCEFRQSNVGLEQRVVDNMQLLKQIDYSAQPELFYDFCQQFSDTARTHVWKLSSAVPLHLTLITDNHTHHAVILACHHIMLDQEALARFRSDWQQTYLQLCDVNHDELAAEQDVVDYQIIKHALWQQQNRGSVVWQNSLDFWQSHLCDAQTQLNLPIGNKGQGIAQASVMQQQVGETVQTWVSTLAKQLQCSEFNCWFGLFYGFLYRYCGAQQDITLLLPILGLSPQEDYVGLRLNTLALRQQCDGKQTLNQLITQTRKRFLDATRHGQIPFDEVVDAVGWGGDKAPEVMFVYKEESGRQPLPNVHTQSLALESQQAKFPLTLFVESSSQSQGANCKWEYDSVRVSDQHMQQIQAAWQLFLANLSTLDTEVTALKDVPINTQTYQQPRFITEQQALPATWLVEQLQQAELQHATQLALSQGDVQLSYAQAKQQSGQLANWLQEQACNTAHQPRCLILQKHSPMLVVSIMAAIKAGWCYIPVDPSYPAARVAHIIDDAKPDIILTDRHSASNFALDGRTPWVAVDQSPLPWQHYNQDYQVATRAKAGYIIYTSGSTGKPKGVEVGLSSLAHYLVFAKSTYLPQSLSGGMILHSSVGFDATVTSLFLPWLTGRPLYIVEPSKPLESLCELFSERRYGAVKIAPAHLDVLRQHVSAEHLGNAAHLIIGGDALHYGALESWRDTDVVVFNEYGPTEATVGCGIYRFEPKLCKTYGATPDGATPDGATPDGAVPIGQAIAGTELLVLDKDHNQVPRGVVGELYIAGFSLAHGYVNMPQVTAEKFSEHPFDKTRKVYQSGDLVKYNDEGQLVYLGRKDNQVKLAGNRIELSDVQACTLSIDVVSDAIALIKDNAQGNKVLALYYVCSGAISEQQLRAKLSAALPQYMIPAQLFELAAMPLTHNGKVDRTALLAITPNNNLTTEDENTSPVIDTLRAIWQEVLKLERISVDDNFFALGGDSIVSLQIIFKAREQGLKITPRMMLTHQSIAQLAAVVSLDTQQQVTQQEGVFALTPILQWAIAYNAPQINHLNQSRIVTLPNNCDLAVLQQALLSVINHHGMLRFKLYQAQQQWRAEIAPAFAALQLEEPVSLSHDEFDTWLKVQQSSLDLAQQPWLIRPFVLADNQPCLLWVMHHGAVDHVSWQIIIDDLNRAYQQLLDGESVQLGAVTCGYANWAKWCNTHSVARMDKLSQSRIARLPLYDDDLSTPLLAGDTQVFTQTLQIDLYQELNDSVLTQHAQQVLLVSAMAQAIREWAEIERVLIVSESHGRGVDALDVSRTVGWFTHFNPLLVQTSGRLLDTLHASRQQVMAAAQLASVDRTLDKAVLEQAHVCLNFLGKSSTNNDKQALALDSELLLPYQTGANNHRGFALTLDVEATDKGLKLYWSHACHGDSAQRVKELANCFESNLNALLVLLEQKQSTAFLAICDAQVNISAAQLAQLSEQQPLERVLSANSMQQAMVFHSLHNERGHFYHEQLCFDLPQAKPHDQSHYQHCWQQLVDTHPMLRVKFVSTVTDEPLLVVDSHVQAVWQAVSIESAEQLQTLLDADKEQGFALEQAPLHRVYWLEQGEQIKMLLVHHHGILDGWSVSLLLAQFTDLLNNKPVAKASYDLVAQKNEFAIVAPFWRSQLTDFVHSKLPLDTVSVMQQAEGEVGHYISEYLHLSMPETDALKALARSANVSINTVLQGAWALVLQRQQGHAKVCFGVTHAGRQPERGQLQQSIGLFIETLPLPIDYQGQTQLGEWLGHIQQQMGQVQSHAADLGELKVIAGLSAESRLFDSLVVFENYPHERQPSHFVFDFAIEKTETPLTLVISEQQGLNIKFNYHSPSAAGHEQLLGLIGQLERVLQQLSGSQLSAPLAHINTVPLEQQARLLNEWQGEHVPLPAQDFVSLFDKMVAQYPQQCAVSAPNGELSYAQLAVRSEQLAATLLGKGITAGEYVGVCYRAHSDLLVAIIALLKAGAAYIPIEPNYPAQRKQYMLKQAQAQMLLCDDTQDEWLQHLDVSAYQVDELIQQPVPRPEVWPHLSHKSPCYAIYTSGSTGQPKGVAISHGALLNYVAHCQRAYHYPVAGKVPVTTSISFDATVTSLLVPIASGAQVQLFSQETQLIELAKGIQAGSFCLAKLTPAHLDLIHQDLGADFKANIHTLVVGGEALHRATCQPWLADNTRIINEYGPTEATVGCCIYDVPDTEQLVDVPIGRAIQNTQLYVLDEDLALLPIGGEGELYIGGKGLAQGYVNQPQLTAERFVPHPFKTGEILYKTGDRAYFDYTGRLHYRGRNDEQVKVRGHRVELSDIEQNILNHKDVAHVAVVLSQGDSAQANGRARMIAFVVAKQKVTNWPALQASLQEEVANSLPDFMHPDVWQQVSQLPLTANSKVDRKALLELAVEQQVTFLEPSTHTEKKLAQIWREQLQVQQVGQQCSFFDLGGHSLKASQILARVQKEFKVKVPLSAFLRMPTLSALAGVIDKAPKVSTSDIRVSSRRKRQ